MAAGVTPGTLIACPMVSGRTWLSRWIDLRGQPGNSRIAELARDSPMLVARLPMDVGLLPLQIPFVLQRRLDARNIEPAQRLLELESLADERCQAWSTAAATTGSAGILAPLRFPHRCRTHSREIRLQTACSRARKASHRASSIKPDFSTLWASGAGLHCPLSEAGDTPRAM